MDAVLNDLTAVARDVFTSGNWVFIALVLVVALIGALMMSNYRQAFGTSVFAMLLLGVFTIIYCVATGTMPGELSTWTAELQSGWNKVMGMTGATLVGYFAMFFVAISLLFTIRRLFIR